MPPLHDLELYLQLVRVALEGLKLLVDLIQALWAASGRSSVVPELEEARAPPAHGTRAPPALSAAGWPPARQALTS
jgi:hypothetical protein